jgi:hypothetical protein
MDYMKVILGENRPLNRYIKCFIATKRLKLRLIELNKCTTTTNWIPIIKQRDIKIDLD